MTKFSDFTLCDYKKKLFKNVTLLCLEKWIQSMHPKLKQIRLKTPEERVLNIVKKLVAIVMTGHIYFWALFDGSFIKINWKKKIFFDWSIIFGLDISIVLVFIYSINNRIKTIGRHVRWRTVIYITESAHLFVDFPFFSCCYGFGKMTTIETMEFW